MISNFIPISSSSFYPLIEKCIKGSNNSKPYFSDIEIEISNQKFNVHRFIISSRCPNILEIDDKKKEKLNSFSTSTAILLLQWIYNGEFIEETISLCSYQELYYIFENIITEKPNICNYLLYKINEIIDSLDNEKFIEEFKKSIDSELSQEKIIQLFYSQSSRRDIDKSTKIKLFKLIRNKNLKFDRELNNEESSSDFSLKEDYDKDIMELANGKGNTDIAFDFDVDMITAHRAILYSRFQFIFVIFQIKSDDNEGLTIPMKENGISHESFKILIDYIYTYDTSKIKLKEDNYKYLLDLYHYLLKLFDKYKESDIDKLSIIIPLRDRLKELFCGNIDEKLIIKIFQYLFNLESELQDETNEKLLEYFTSLISKQFFENNGLSILKEEEIEFINYINRFD